MIDLKSERLLTLREAAQRLPGSPAISTLHRWRQRGIHGIQLETCLIGGKRFTSEAALQRFVDSVTAAVDARETCYETTESEDEVTRQLDQLGL